MKKWIWIILALLLIFVVTSAAMVFGAFELFDQPITPALAEAELASLLENTVTRDESLRNGVLLVEAPVLGVNGAWAVGVADEHDGTAMTVDTPFLSASIGKLFTAATVLSLAEDGVLSLDDTLTDWLDPSVTTGIPIARGESALENVTIRQLLSHRTGIPDYYESETADDAPNVATLLVEEPDRTWTPESLLQYTKDHFEVAPRPEDDLPGELLPGDDFLYSDTNYDLLGMIIEEATGQPFHEVVEARVLQPLQLEDTWYHSRTNPSRSGPADQDDHAYADVFFGDVNLAGVPALSLDWAGGGLATTVDDLRTFMRSLLRGEPVHLDEFGQEWTDNALSRGIDYGYGLWRIRPAGIIFLLRGYPNLFGVSGSTGTFVYYIPEYDAVVAGAFNQSGYQAAHVRFLLRALDVLAKIEQ